MPREKHDDLARIAQLARRGADSLIVDFHRQPRPPRDRRDLERLMASMQQFEVLRHELLELIKLRLPHIYAELSHLTRPAMASGENLQDWPVRVWPVEPTCDWPGISRELRLIEGSAVAAAAGNTGAPPEPIRKSIRKRARRKNRASAPKPLTAKQAEAVQIVGECKGNIAEAARRLGVHRSTVQEHYRAAMAKLGQKAISHKTQAMPHDQRGQGEVADADDGPAAIGPRPRVKRDKR